MIEGIEKILPGHCLVVESGRIEDQKYCHVPFGQTE